MRFIGGNNGRAAGPLSSWEDVSTIDDAVMRMQQDRGRRIELLQWSFTEGTLSGLWAAARVNDYIVYPQDALPTRRAAIIAHELAHMILGHEPQERVEGTEQLVRLLAPTLDPQIVCRMLARHSENTPEEIAAEQLGTEMLSRLQIGSRIDPLLDRLLI